MVYYSKAEREKGKNYFPALAKMLEQMQVYSEQADQGILIEGEEHFHGGDYDAEGDGRMALTFGIAGLIAAETITIENADCANDVYPGFWDEFHKYTKGQVRFA
ncbi:MAG: hypothetical protein GEU75_05560 [Dehalococcoidia bacterium]|nr:hypothetical protein [Dehalococcoidia bacterium]